MIATARDGWVVGEVLARQAERIPDRVYIQRVDGPSITFGEMHRSATRVAKGLQGFGVAPGDRVLVMLPNGIEFVQVWCGIGLAGAVLVPLNTALRGAFLEHIANNSGARLMIIQEAFLPVLQASEPRLPQLERVVVIEDSAGAPQRATLRRIVRSPFEALLEPGVAPAGHTVTHRDIGAILYTSGTTGPSKGALLPHGHLYLNAHIYIQQLRITAEDVIYCCLPLFHANGLLLQTYGAMILGARLVLRDGFSASTWLDDIRRYDATVTNLLGVMTEFVYRQPERPGDGRNRLRVATAVPTPKAFGADFERRFGVKLIELYGTTEVNCPLYMPIDEALRPGSCGRLIDEWFEARIVGPATDEPLPAGEVGELVVRPKAPFCFMMGYHGMPEETVSASRNFWFHTGDALYCDEDGYFYFVDRLKDRIRHRGENVSSYEAEIVLNSHEAIAEAAVVGVPSQFADGEHDVKACVVLKPGAELTPEALIAFCRERMPRFAVPRYVAFLDALPKTQTQKVKKQDLRAAGVEGSTWDRLAAEAGQGRSRD